MVEQLEVEVMGWVRCWGGEGERGSGREVEWKGESSEGGGRGRGGAGGVGGGEDGRKVVEEVAVSREAVVIVKMWMVEVVVVLGWRQGYR